MARTAFEETRDGWVCRGPARDQHGYPRRGVELRLIERLVPLAGRDVLEIGCGDGRLTFQYAEAARRVVAVDPGSDAIARARGEARRRGLDHVRFLNRAAQDGLAGLGRFEVVLFSWSL